MSQPYDPGYGGGQPQPWGAPGQQPPGGQPGQPGLPAQQGGGYPPPQGGYPQQGGYPPQQGGYAPPPGYPPQYQQQPPGYPPQHQAYGQPPWQPTAPGRKGSPLGIGVAIAGALMALGTLLPWISVKLQLSTSNIAGTPLPGSDISRSLAGIKASEGKIVMLCALVAIGIGIAATVSNGKLGIIAAAPAVVAILVIFKVFADKASYDDKLPNLGGQSSVHVSLQAGIIISLIMAVAIIALGLISTLVSRSK